MRRTTRSKGMGELLVSALRCVALASAAVFLVSAQVQAAGEARVALVVGNGAYRSVPSLPNPTKDATAVAATLRSLGFEVLLHTDVGKAAFERAVGQFGERLRAGSTGLFYYAGHGMQMQGRNYLIPVDAVLSSEARVRLETVDTEVVLDQMAASKTRVNIAILDACRNNPFERKHRSASAGLAQMSAPEGTLIAYATAPGRVAADGEGDNGLYTSELIKTLKEPGLAIESVFKRVRAAVSRSSNGEQIPWESSSLTGDFYFSGQPASEAASVIPVPSAAPPPGHQGEERAATVVVAPAPGTALVIRPTQGPTPAPTPTGPPTAPPPRPKPAAAKNDDDLGPLVCRTTRRSESTLGQTVARQGMECRQADGSWKIIE